MDGVSLLNMILQNIMYVVCTWLRSNMFLCSGYVRADSGSAVNNNPGYHQGISWPTDAWVSNTIKDIYLLRLGWRAVWGLIWGRRNSQFLYKGSFHGSVGPSTFWEGATRKKEPPPPPSSNHSTATPLWGFFTLISCLSILSSWKGVSQDISLYTKAHTSINHPFLFLAFFNITLCLNTKRTQWLKGGGWFQEFMT